MARKGSEDGEPLEALVAATLAGQKKAWQALVKAIAPRIESIARGHEGLRARGLAALPDDLAEVKTAALERIAAGEYKNLARYRAQREREPEAAQSFDSWLYGAVDFAIRDHLRKRFGRAPQPVAVDGAPRAKRPSKRDLGTHAARFDEALHDRSFVNTLGMTAKLTAAQIYAHVDASFTPREARAIRLYYKDELSLAEIAKALKLSDERAADKLIRKLNARLRYKFAAG